MATVHWAAVLPRHVGRQHVMERPHGPSAEACDAIEHGECVVLLGLVTEHARHLCPFVVDGDGAWIVQGAPLAHLDLLGGVAGNEVALYLMPCLGRVTEQPVNGLAA